MEHLEWTPGQPWGATPHKQKRKMAAGEVVRQPKRNVVRDSGKKLWGEGI